MGILPSDPTVRGFHCLTDSHRESLTSPVHEMQKRLAHSPHLQNPKKLSGMCQKTRSHPSLGSRCTSAVQSFLALAQLNVSLTPRGDSRDRMRPYKQLLVDFTTGEDCSWESCWSAKRR